jgi:N-methylhydantoinase B
LRRIFPITKGVLRPIKVKAPYGSIANSKPPAAGGARALIGHFFPMMVIQALSKALPDRVVATVGSPLWCINATGHREDGSPFANMFFTNGGYGAAIGRDGAHVLSWPSNVSSTPVEMIEQLVPLKVHFRRFRVGSGGKGEFRGGNGQEILFESRAPGPVTGRISRGAHARGNSAHGHRRWRSRGLRRAHHRWQARQSQVAAFY